MMNFRPGLKQISVALACAALAAVLGHFAATELINAQRERQLADLGDVALRRAERVVDYGRASLEEISRRPVGNCDPASLQALRLQVYQRSTIKDVRVIGRDGAVRCSAFSETLEFDKGWAQRSDMLQSQQGGILLFRVEQFAGTALGIAKDIDQQTSVVAIIGLNSDIFDVLPRELIGGSAITLKLRNGEIFCASPPPALEAPVAFSKASARYPFYAEVQVAPAALAQWNTEPYWPIMISATGLGLVFGGLLATILFRPVSPVAELDRALANRSFRPYFQPTFDLRSGEIVGCEVLARWLKADGSVVPPLNFIPLAESSGRIAALTWYLMGEALEQLRPVLKQNRQFVVSFNVTPDHLVADDFVAGLRAIAISRRVSPRQITLEVTERNAFADLDKAARVVAELRDRGFGVALDDVGIGHNGLSQIHVLGADVLKIDKFFVDLITRGGSGNATIEMLVRLAAELKMTVVAEGIETSEQRAALLACGVGKGQGYLVSPPLPAQGFLALLHAQQAANQESLSASAEVVRVA